MSSLSIVVINSFRFSIEIFEVGSFVLLELFELFA